MVELIARVGHDEEGSRGFNIHSCFQSARSVPRQAVDFVGASNQAVMRRVLVSACACACVGDTSHQWGVNNCAWTNQINLTSHSV